MLRRRILKKLLVPRDFESCIDQCPKPVGSFGYDPWGFQIEGAKIGLSLIYWLYKHYWRVEAFGIENVPPSGRVLIIANHSGQIPFDGGLIMIAMATNPLAPRLPRVMIERFFPGVPYVNSIVNMCGAVIGDPINCVKMLENEEAVLVFPEGVRGSGKLFRDRYQLKRFGNGFMHIALSTNTPILPVGVVGCEETMPSLANIKPLAKLLKLPYVPLTTPVPFPVKVRLYFGELLRFQGPAKNEQEAMAMVEQVKDSIRGLISKGLEQRKGFLT